MNNRSLTYVESDVGEHQVLTPNIIVWGQNSYILEDIEVEFEILKKFQRRLQHAGEHAWRKMVKRIREKSDGTTSHEQIRCSDSRSG